jgi:hypothetical protein
MGESIEDLSNGVFITIIATITTKNRELVLTLITIQGVALVLTSLMTYGFSQ